MSYERGSRNNAILTMGEWKKAARLKSMSLMGQSADLC